MKKIKTSEYLILSVVVLVIIVPLARFYTVDPKVNACMIEYVDTMSVYKPAGFLYKIDGVNHIEPEDSIYNKYLYDHRIGYSEGCIMASGRLFTDFNNTVYCSFAFMAKTGLNKYSNLPHLTLAERFILFKSQEKHLYSTLKSDLMIMEDMLFHYVESSKGDVFFTLKYLTNNTIDKIQGFYKQIVS